MPQDGEIAVRPSPPMMPKPIAMAIIKTIGEIEGAEARSQGDEGSRTFKYASINDVLAAAHEALKTNGLAIAPIEVSYSEELVQRGVMTQMWARYGYRFRLIHKDGESWIDEADTRHISIAINESGMSAGKAQSLALRDYLKGLLRIRTVEPDVESAEAATTDKPEITVNLGKPRPATMPFVFGGDKMAAYDADQVKQLFDKIVAPLSKALRSEWELANRAGLEQLHEVNKKISLHIKRGLERD